MYCCLPTKLQRELSKLLKITYIIMMIYYVTPMMPLYNGFYLFSLSRAVNSNRLIFDPSEVEIHNTSFTHWTNEGFSFKLLTVNLFRHPTLIKHGLKLHHSLSLFDNTVSIQNPDTELTVDG